MPLSGAFTHGVAEDDSLYRAEAVGRSDDGLTAEGSRSRPIRAAASLTAHLFVDTAGWMAMADAADPMHTASRGSRDAWLRSGGNLISTDYVIGETLTLIRVRLGLRAAARWWKQIDASSRLRWEWITPPRAEKASWFFDWNDKRSSFTDCNGTRPRGFGQVR